MKERSKAKALGPRGEEETANEAEKGAGEKLGESEIPEAKEKGVINCEKRCFAPGQLGTEKHSDTFLAK